ncbi:YgdI/YgdR family lipoprotein [Pantoea sp. Mb-10]|uniref:YgdI/YgdR family lipoprotein n=1 Tax=Pantoea eucrina TaxID=472693 RepID=A0ABU5LFJ3_9GAMM|nr:MULTISPECIES: YgdI/YgdR family lipoprotein [Pantoea]MCE0490667.1 YgdI/YgdR family lipoprotein [Pantoea sp. Mb-10]MCE0500175.1 YgdI/YgdR family lipoprotein [Pantoea sp. Pb-8]MDZ7278707.1 YgdI/YgdR family lipoprotein [Pantoea eucrina]
MKKTLCFIATFSLGLALAGCASDHVLQTTDGKTIVAQGKPVVDEDTGMITYKDIDGKEQQINRNQIKEMNSVN